jgi:hypothetical protein
MDASRLSPASRSARGAVGSAAARALAFCATAHLCLFCAAVMFRSGVRIECQFLVVVIQLALMAAIIRRVLMVIFAVAVALLTAFRAFMRHHLLRGLGFTLLDNASSEVPQTEAGSPPIIASDEHHAARADVLNSPNRRAGPVGFAFFDLHLTHPGLGLCQLWRVATVSAGTI